MSDLLALQQFNLTPDHPWSNAVARLILCDVYGWGENCIDADIWTDDDARENLGIAYDQTTQHCALVDSANRNLRAVAILDEQYFVTNRAMYLDSLAVPQNLRGLGLGSEMLRYMESHARSSGALVLQLYATERKRQFYLHRDYGDMLQGDGCMEKFLYDL